MNLYTLALELTLVLAAWLAIGAWQRDSDVPGRLTYAAAAMAVAIWVGGELIEVRGEMALLGRRVLGPTQPIQLVGDADEHEAHVGHDCEQHLSERLGLLYGECFARLPMGRKVECIELLQSDNESRNTL